MSLRDDHQRGVGGDDILSDGQDGSSNAVESRFDVASTLDQKGCGDACARAPSGVPNPEPRKGVIHQRRRPVVAGNMTGGNDGTATFDKLHVPPERFKVFRWTESSF
ncbi:hypothetical protein BV22DRAFT_1045371 [Leucogyrophana mollusca]|uniref:Uncharacterized protein n=1 Tax=Leucogyrophana mollusca TaxID=85980 RepID=A0ACB8BQC5_9AGAM|nr:hypothetical protein BV22DRAFT_1045371 [Leucogyrophana mollusca]